MPIQHRNIPDNQLHEIKGAASAIPGSVPVADGTGRTRFEKLGVKNFTGSIPEGVPNLTLVTDGQGGFKTSNGIYGTFRRTRLPGFPIRYRVDALITPNGLYTIHNEDSVYPTETGFYLFVADPYYNNGDEGIEFIHTELRRIGDNLVLGNSGRIFQLNAGVAYTVNTTEAFSLLKVG